MKLHTAAEGEKGKAPITKNAVNCTNMKWAVNRQKKKQTTRIETKNNSIKQRDIFIWKKTYLNSTAT